MTVRHEHETRINTIMTKIQILLRLKQMMLGCGQMADARSSELHQEYLEEYTKTLADIENSLYLKLDEVVERHD